MGAALRTSSLDESGDLESDAPPLLRPTLYDERRRRGLVTLDGGNGGSDPACNYFCGAPRVLPSLEWTLRDAHLLPSREVPEPATRSLPAVRKT